MIDHSDVRCLIITSIFPPLNGGSAVVYDNLCQQSSPDTMKVFTCWRDYATGNEISGWKEHDYNAPYTIIRTELLRPISTLSKSRLHSLYNLILYDIPLKIKIALKVFSIVKINKINIVCIGELNSGSWIGLICKIIFKCKLINYIHGEEVTSTTTYLLYGRNREFYLKQADAVVAVSQFTKHALIKLMHVNPEKITVIENGVNTSKFHPAPKDEKLLAKHNLVNKKVILTVGRLVERKGVDKTILALPKIIQKIPDIHYLVVGTGEFSETLKKLVAEQNLTNFVTFAGRVSEGDLLKYYQSCDLFIMPNRELADHDTEGFGLVFLEANACKKPVIGGKAGGAVEAVKDGETGILVDGNNPDEIAAAVISLLNNPDLMSNMAQTGYELAIKSSWKNKTQLFYQLCDKLLQKN